MPFQIIRDVPEHGAPFGANICLHNDSAENHLGQAQGEARLAMRNWDTPFAMVDAKLSSITNNVGTANVPHLESTAFYLYPDLRISVISEDIALGFGLLPVAGISFFRRTPLFYAMPAVAISPISGRFTVRATVNILGPKHIFPRPIVPQYESFEFHIPDPEISPPGLAIFGKNVIESMLLIYQGRHRHKDALPKSPTTSRFYFGANHR